MQSVTRSLLILLLFAPSLFAGELVRVVAVVNNEAITSVQLDKALAAQGGETGGEARRKVLDGLIEESLLRQRAAEIGLQVADEEVEAAVQDVLQQNRLTPEQLEEALRQQGVTLIDYRESLRRQILRYKVVGREVQGRLEVSGREIRSYYEQNQSEFRATATVGLQRLTFPLPVGAGERQAVRERAAEAAGQLRNGLPFAGVASAFAADGAEGVDVGIVQEEELTPAFAAEIRTLAVGGCSAPLEAGNALHLLCLTSRTPGKARPLEEVRETIRARLAEQKKAGAAKAWLDELRGKAHLEIRL